MDGGNECDGVDTEVRVSEVTQERDSVGVVFFFKQKTAYEMRISDWSSDVCSSDLVETVRRRHAERIGRPGAAGQSKPAGRRGPPEAGAGPAGRRTVKIGRASCRERVRQYV